MKDDLENVKNLGTDLMREMQGITSDFRIGEKNSVIIDRGAERYAARLKMNFLISFRLRLLRGEDGHAVHQHHSSQAHQPLHGEPELHQPLQLQERPEADGQGRRVQSPGQSAADLRQPGLPRGRLRRHHAGGGLRGKKGLRASLRLAVGLVNV